MPRDGAIIFSDLIGKLDMLRIERRKCGRSGRYRLADLITRYGRDEKLFAFTSEITASCARKQARSDSDPCGAICPDLPKVLSGRGQPGAPHSQAPDPPPMPQRQRIHRRCPRS
jgi:hypothetical protein